MATTWILRCESGGESATLKIVDSLNPLPGSDKWYGVEGAAVWGDPAEGAIANWGTGRTQLHAGGGSVFHILEGFTKATVKDDEGTGDKTLTGGSFPDGSFSWVCTSRT